MSILKIITADLQALFRKNQMEEKMDGELPDHLDAMMKDKKRSGMNQEKALRAARVEMGSVDAVKEEIRGTGWEATIGTLVEDLRYAFRLLKKAPGFAAVVIMVLSLGIGANTAIFSLVESVLLQPIPANDPGRIMAIYTSGPHGADYSSTSYPDYECYRDHTHVFDGVMAYARIRLAWTHGNETDFPWAEIVSGNYFSVLGVKPFMGHALQPQENATPGSGPVAVVSYEFWQRQLGSDPNVLGKSLTPNAHTFTVAGVAPMGFSGVNLDWGTGAGIWVPLSMQDQILPAGFDLLHARGARWLLVVARLSPGVSPAQARAGARLAAQQLAQSYPVEDKDRVAILLPASQARIWPTWREQIVKFLGLLMGAAGLVLLIACSNAANLLLSRAEVRRREIATRLALGASRARVVQQLLIESAMLTVGAAAGGLGLAMLIMQGVPGFRLPFRINIALHPQLDSRVLAFTMALSVLTVLLFGIVPALESSRSSLGDALKDGGRQGTSRRGRRIRNVLVMSQVALTLVCTIGAALLLRNLYRVETTNPSFDYHHVLVATAEFDTRGYSDTEKIRFYGRLLDNLRQSPGIRSASLTSELPLSLMRAVRSVVPDGSAGRDLKQGSPVQTCAASPGFLATFHIPLLRGREFSSGDNQTAPKVVIVNRTLAEAFWPGQDPIGKRLLMTGEESYREVVGVASDIKYHALWESPEPYLYLPLLQDPASEVHFVIRTVGDPMSLMPAVRRVVSALDPQVPLYDVTTLDDQFRDSLSQPRMAAYLVGFFSLLSLVLASVGIYSLVSYLVAQRTHEIGVRMALGARTGDVLRLVVGQGLALVLAGIGVGLVAALGLTRLMAGMLYGVRPTDLVTFAAVSLVLGAVALLACYVPARRATKVDPMVALRHE